MAAKIKIPEELNDAYRRLMELLPIKLIEEGDIQKKTLLFLKFGGEMLARHYIEIAKIRHKEKSILERRLRREKALKESRTAPVAEPGTGNLSSGEKSSDASNADQPDG